jgi:hypothetical protein
MWKYEFEFVRVTKRPSMLNRVGVRVTSKYSIKDKFSRIYEKCEFKFIRDLKN